MPNALDLRRRIKGVKNIQKITQAMKMVAAVRLRKAQERVKESLPYFQGLATAIDDIVKSGEEISNVLFAQREVMRTGYLVIGADKGLAGSYGSNVIRAVQRHIGGEQCVGLVVVGRKVRDYFERRKLEIDKAFIGISEKPKYQHAIDIGSAIIDLFGSGKYDKVFLVYTQFYSPGSQQVVVEHLLPITPKENVSTCQIAQQIYDPSLPIVLEEVAAKWLEASIFRGLIHAAASEMASRLNAMSLATDNAQDLISQLVLEYNKVRQANITREISEIVGGSEALR